MECGLRLHHRHKASTGSLPLVSIITVVLNGAGTIEKCITSVLNQTYDNIEYIIIDGGSSDDTTNVIGKYCDNIDYAISEPDSGIYNAFNKGISLASGDYIIVLNSDDWYAKDAIALLVKGALRSGSDITHANVYTVFDNGSVNSIMKGWLHDGLYTRGMPIRHETMLTKKSVYERFGYYDEKYKIISDYDYLISLYTGGCSFKHINKELLYFRTSGVSHKDAANRFTERKMIFGELFPFLDTSDLDLMARYGKMSHKLRIYFIKKYLSKRSASRLVRSMIYNLVFSIVEDVLKPITVVRNVIRARLVQHK